MLSSFSKIAENAVPFTTDNFREKNQAGTFDQMEKAFRF